jgi:sterol desaturase/sphingolipid hydroxylase (fatty acid hydroxylase superfamily)
MVAGSNPAWGARFSPVAEVLYYAIPAFVLLLVMELLSFKYLRDDDLIGYESRDTRTSLTMGGGNVVINAVWKLVVLVAYAGLYELTPLRMPADEWWTYVLLFFADDLAYYWFHRVHHEVRVFWASHVVHHSSQHYNLSTALRQTWTPMTALPFWAPLALLGFAPWMILLQLSISLIYQFWMSQTYTWLQTAMVRISGALLNWRLLARAAKDCGDLAKHRNVLLSDAVPALL